MNISKKLISIILATLISIGVLSFTSYASEDGVKIVFKIGAVSYQLNGNFQSLEKSMVLDNSVFVPADVFVEAFGAELSSSEDGSFGLSYRNTSIDMSLGNMDCTVNQNDEELPAAPFKRNSSIMVPFRFIAESLGASVSFSNSDRTVSAVLDDDGALTDLSFLTDSIKKSKVGDSFYGWSMNIPQGSRIASTSFNSRDISIENENRSIEIGISIKTSDADSIEEYYNQVLEDPETYLDGEVPQDSSFVSDAPLPYAEFIYTGPSQEPVIQRSYMNSNYVYSVMLSYYSDSGTDDLTGSSYYKSMLDSFSFGYDGKSPDVQDLTRVSFGMATYDNYITFDSGKKYYSWEISAPPEWDNLNSAGDNPLYSKLGLTSDEYISIDVSKADSASSLEKAGNTWKSLYEANFNPQLCSLKNTEMSSVAGYKSYRLLFGMKLGGEQYTYDENIIIAGGIQYDLTLKAPADTYDQNKALYEKVLNSFKPSDNITKDYLNDLDSYQSQQTKNRVGRSDLMTDYQNKQYNWSIKIPGAWTKDTSSDGLFTSFLDHTLGLSVAVEVSENSKENDDLSDTDRFSFMGSITNRDGVNPVNESQIEDRGKSIKTYTYRWESSDDETYADINFYIIKGQKYTYCYFSVIPDEYKCDFNIKQMSDIWNSFSTEG